jgi:hypothetical protein
MRQIITILFLFTAAPALADNAIAITPVFSQLVTMPVPQGFASGYEASNDTNYLNELVPQGESVNDWTQMISLTGAKGQSTGNPGEDAARFANNLAGLYQGACPASFTAAPLDAPEVPGAASSLAAFIGCGDNGMGHSEAMVLLVIVGAADIYTLQWAAHGPLSSSPLTYDPAAWSPRLAEFAATARLCDPVAGEAAPYPSCLP